MATEQDQSEKVIPQEIVHKQMTIDDILNRFSSKAQRIAQTLTNAGLHCIGCQASTWETLEAGMKGHGMSDADVDQMVEKLNAILAEKSDPSTISMTPRAAKKFLQILEEDDKKGWGLRFGIKRGGCSGLEYILDYSKEALDSDKVIVSQGVEIHIGNEHLEGLLGSEIDYVDGLQGAGFKISNPNAKRSCGCGNSYSC